MHKGNLDFMNIKRIRNYFTACLMAAIVVFLPSIMVSAQSNGLGVTPKLTYNVAPGAQRTDSLYVNNLSTSQALNLKLTVVDFRPQDESGTPQLLNDTNAPQTPWSLKPYITLPEFVTVEAGKSKLIPFTIKIPSNVGAGSYYSAVEYTALKNANQERVNIAASSATLVFVDVPGNALEQLNMLQFGSYGKSGYKNIFTGSAPSSFSYRIKNHGNISENPSGSLVVKNFFGHVVASINDANPRDELVLLGQTRKFVTCNPKNSDKNNLGKPDNCKPLNLKPGRYTAQVELLYGQNGHDSKQIGAKSTFWYLPIWFIVVVLVVLVALLYSGYRIYKKISAPRHRHAKHKS
jgi:hypothetical protein